MAIAFTALLAFLVAGSVAASVYRGWYYIYGLTESGDPSRAGSGWVSSHLPGLRVAWLPGSRWLPVIAR